MNKLKVLTLMIIFVMITIFVAPRLQKTEAAAPANDDFYSATLISSLPFTDAIDTTEATADPNDPSPCRNYPNNSVWYRYTPPDSNFVQISTEGSDYNTIVGVFVGDYSALNQANCYTGNSPFTISLSAGTTYYIMIVGGTGSYPSPIGNYGGALQISISESTDSWGYTGSMKDSHSTATLLGDGRVLATGGYRSEVYDPATGTWVQYIWQGSGSSGNTATLLSDGRVLIVGGYVDYSGATSSAMIYDPAAGSWNSTGSLNTARDAHSATLLPDGRVLVTGGRDSNHNFLNSSEVYDPETGAWSYTGSLNNDRHVHTATLLQDGHVLVVGGQGSAGFLASAELYDPGTGAWSLTGSLNTGRVAHTATLLSDGRVLAAGGFGNVLGGYLSSSEVYDPTTGEWSPTGSMSINRQQSQATLLPDGRVLMAGGYNNKVIASAEVYDPVTGVWSLAYPMNSPRSGAMMTLLNDRRVLVTGGDINLPTSAEIYWYLAPPPPPPPLPPVNDNFANATLIDNFPFTNTIDNSTATVEPGEPTPYCASYWLPAKTAWYVYTPTTKGMLSGHITSSSPAFMVVYSSNSPGSLDYEGCGYNDYDVQVSVIPGTTYYIQIGSRYEWEFGNVTLNLNFIPPPPNDDFANAMSVESIPFFTEIDIFTSTSEAGEPNPGCTWGDAEHTVWYRYTPSASGSITAEKTGNYYSFVAGYSGSSFDNLQLLGCGASYDSDRFTIHVDQDVVYYFQLGSPVSNFWNLTFNLSIPPPPTADFWWSPNDPSIFDVVNFCSNSYDPVGVDFVTFYWDSGDGVQQQGDNPCFYRQYPKDGDYTAYLQVLTRDGRSAEVTKVVPVRTHDVAITKFVVPQAARVGQTRSLTVGVRNNRYPENVTVNLYKVTPYADIWVGALNQSVPVRPSNRTTDFNFSYTFTNEDAKLGKLTFKAVATITNARDAIPADNEAISLPTKVNGYVP